MLPDAFGCVVANRFGNLLDDDADPFDLISEVETENDKKKKNKEQEMKLKQKKMGQKESQKDRRVPKALDGQDLVPAHKQQQTGHAPGTDRDGGQEVQRGMKRGATGQRRVTQEEQPLEFSISKPSDNESNVRGRGGMRGGGGGGRRGGRGGGYTRNPDYLNMRGKREYDRHNGTGISPEEKRGGRGPWNWGCVEEAASELMEVTSDAAIKSEEPQIPVEEDNLNRETDENKEVVVEVAMEMTLDEWKALQETSRPKAEFNIRKTDHQIPSKAKVIHQSKHLGNLKETMEDEGNFLRRSVNDITSLLDINFGSVGRPSRGGRGRGRGAQSTRLERAEQIMERDDLAPNPDDPEDFPALSAGR
ncbi:intracellular hyaluronan-binding protein 4-like isoform X2 [Melanotaenia boesemani]|uniref:intracellular hyaluronan-binding protein 4-like isoform X2 n=1 Tax=Melanotaenia boesemani TaxID=1250792 RepID=UPI001C04A395|nr:intracellular hyaluronan-binding protein 4-like isoform X2 [Melanotaenia boesemani]